jgi:hypothetical protein
MLKEVAEISQIFIQDTYILHSYEKRQHYLFKNIEIKINNMPCNFALRAFSVSRRLVHARGFGPHA